MYVWKASIQFMHKPTNTISALGCVMSTESNLWNTYTDSLQEERGYVITKAFSNIQPSTFTIKMDLRFHTCWQFPLSAKQNFFIYINIIKWVNEKI